MIVANYPLKSRLGFGVDSKAVTIIDRIGKRTEVPTSPKMQVAAEVMTTISELSNNGTLD